MEISKEHINTLVEEAVNNVIKSLYRVCTRCGKGKPISEYPYNGKTKTGRKIYRYSCRSCERKRMSDSYVSRKSGGFKLGATGGKAAKLHDFRGEKLTLKEVAALSGVGAPTLLYRMKTMGLSLEEACRRAVRSKE